MRTDWSAYPLGELPDAEIARQAGVSRHAVVNARHRRGIPAFKTPKPERQGLPCGVCGEKMTRITNSHLAHHGMSIKEYKQHYGSIVVPKAERIDWASLGLGKRSDRQIAQEAGVSARMVSDVRRGMGIPVHIALRCNQCGQPFVRPKGKWYVLCESCRVEVEWPPMEELSAMLKTGSVAQVAAKLGVRPGSLYAHISRAGGTLKKIRK